MNPATSVNRTTIVLNPGVCWFILLASTITLVSNPGLGSAEEPPAASSTSESAFTGLAQAPEANLFLGSASMSIPIAVPPGRRGMTPKLALAYSSGSGIGPIGYGWSFPVGRIQRARTGGALLCDSQNPDAYEFVLELPAGNARCTLQPDGKCEVHPEESFLDVRFDFTTNSWTVRERGGQIYVFGADRHAREGSGSGNASDANGTLFDATVTPCRYTASWGISEAGDANGNFISYVYTKSKNLSLLSSVSWGGSRHPGLPHLFRLQLEWSYYGQTSIVTAHAGLVAFSENRLSEIVVESRNLASSDWDTIRSYLLTYNVEYGDPASAVPLLLESVAVRDSQGILLAGAAGPAQTNLIYAREEGFITDYDQGYGFGLAQRTSGTAGLASHRDWLRWHEARDDFWRHTRRDVMDMNGDGFVDLVEAPPCAHTSEAMQNWKVFLGSESGFSATGITWSIPAAIGPTGPPGSSYPGRCAIRGSSANNDQAPLITNREVRWATIDMTGDSIPDHVSWVVDEGESVFEVYRGIHPGAGGSWGFSPIGELWRHPGDPGPIFVSESTEESIAPFGEGWNTTSELVDLNGDGLVDLVRAGGPGSSSWTVWYNISDRNQEAKFSNPVQFLSPFPQSIRFAVFDGSSSSTVLTLQDMNGDGLPDQVVADSSFWIVHLNTGHGFDPAGRSWGSTSTACGIGAQVSDGGGQVISELIDINGDGLPDRVNTCDWANDDPVWQVQFNSGTRFGWSTDWPSPHRYVRDGDAERTVRDTFDIDGDGLADLVDPKSEYQTSILRIYRNAGGAWCASANSDSARVFDSSCSESAADGYAANPEAAKPYLLQATENGVGGRTTLTYRPSSDGEHVDESTGLPTMPFALWTVVSVTKEDGMCDASGCVGPDGSHAMVTRFAYEHGVFDPVWREFRGFGTTETVYADESRQTTTFHQDRARKGKQEFVYRFGLPEGGDPYFNWLSQRWDAWQCADRSTGSTVACGGSDDVWVRRASTYDFTFEEGSPTAYKFSGTQNLTWATCGESRLFGNVERVRSVGSGTTSVEVVTEYACPSDLDDPTPYIVDRPISTRTTSGGNVLQQKWFYYDLRHSVSNEPIGARGNLTLVQSWLDQWSQGSDMPVPGDCIRPPTGGYGGCVAVSTQYDNFGNPEIVTDENDNDVTTVYDDSRIYPKTTTNQLGHSVFTIYDTRCGTITHQSIPYAAADPIAAGPLQPASRTTFDDYCRPGASWAPDEPGTSPPSRLTCHTLGGGVGASWQPSTVRVLDKVPCSGCTPNAEPCSATHSGYKAAWILLDALGRVIQQQHQAVVEGAPVIVVASTNSFDSRGRLAESFVPFQVASGGSYETPSGGVSSTFEYDVLGRLVQSVNPGGELSRADYKVAWQTTQETDCTASATPTCSGKSVEIRNAFGQVIEKHAYDGGTIAAKTAFTYDGLGRLKTSTQWDGSIWNASTTATYMYDSLGRKLTHDDPDSGLWRYAYDLAGNLIVQDDPNGSGASAATSPPQHLQLCYDVIGRMTRKFIVDDADFEDLQAPNGRRIDCEDEDPQAAVVRFDYDDPAIGVSIGQLTKVTDTSGTTSILQFDARGRSLKIAKTVDLGDHVESVTMTYKYDGAYLDEIRYPDLETVEYQYDSVGNPVGLESLTTGAIYVYSRTYDEFGRPKSTFRGSSTGTAGVAEEVTYHDHSKNFRLASISVLPPAGSGYQGPACGPSGTTKYLGLNYSSYSRRGQLSLLTDVHGNCSELNNSGSFTYDGVGRLTEVVGAFNGTYAYDHLGNLVEKEGRTLAYELERPHVLATTTTGGQTTAVGHDHNGNRITKNGVVYKYDPEGRLVEAAGDVRNSYDYTGQRVLRVEDPLNGAPIGFRYFAPEVETRNKPNEYWGRMTKHYFFGGVRVASRDVGWNVPPVVYARTDSVPPFVVVASARGWGYDLRVRPDVQQWIPTLAFAGFLTLVLLPERRRRRVVGIRLRRGPTLLVIGLWTVGTFPGPVFLVPTQPAWANGGGGSAPPKPTEVLRHLHYDHLGSLQLMTSASGQIVQHIRYTPFGQERGRYNAQLQAAQMDLAKYTFTGYEQDGVLGLQYANARWYDPDLGQFTSHDPARQFASPYNYAGWDPTNVIDPSGAFGFGIDWGVIAIIAIIAGAAAAGIDAGLKTGDPLAGFTAASINLAIGLVSAVGLGLTVGPIFEQMNTTMRMATVLSLGSYGVYNSVDDGAYVSAGVTGTFAVLGALGITQASNGSSSGDEASANGRGDDPQGGSDDVFRPTHRDVVQGIRDLEAHRDVLRFEGLSPLQVGFDSGIPIDEGRTRCDLFGSCMVVVSDRFSSRDEFTATLWHESVHVHQGWFGALYPAAHARLTTYDAYVLKAFRTGDFGGLGLPATAGGGLDLSVPGPNELR